jgi:hypothetical protein
VLNSPKKLAWIVVPDAEVQREWRTAQLETIRQLREQVSKGVIRKDGTINSASAQVVLNGVELIFAFADDKGVRKV